MNELWHDLKSRLMTIASFHSRSWLKRYSFAVIILFLVFFLKFYFYPILGISSAFILLTFAVTISALYGGLGPGLLCTFLAVVFNYEIFLMPNLMEPFLQGDLILSAVFVMEGVIISVISESIADANRQKDEFIGFAGHELKNPLSAIKGFSELITLNHKKGKYDKMLLYAQEIGQQSDKATDLINDLLDVTKIEIGKFTYKKELFKIDDLIRQTVEYQRVIYKQRQVQLIGISKREVVGDRYRIGQVLINLLVNALKYSEPEKKVVVSVKNRRNSVLISVRDLGIGIAPQDQKRIFTPYFRTSSAKKNMAEGLGLGLYISSKIVQDHHGRLWVKSTVGKGSTFYLELATYSKT